MVRDKTTKHSILSKLTVARRIYLLLSISLLVLTALGAAGLLALNTNYLAFTNIGTRINTLYASQDALLLLNRDYRLTLHELNANMISANTAKDRLTAAEQRLRSELLPLFAYNEKNKTSPQPQRPRRQDKSTLEAMNSLQTLLTEAITLVNSKNPTELNRFIREDLAKKISPIVRDLSTTVSSDLNSTRLDLAQGLDQSSRLVKQASLAILGALILTVLLGYWIYRSISLSIKRLISTIRDVEAGHLNSRVELPGKDELAELGNNFDRMMDERLTIQARIDREHKNLNESVYGLLQAVSDLSDRNLTVRAKVTEDATGPLADAINQLAEDTTDVLKQVRQIAFAVENTSLDVNQHAQSVNQLAQLEQTEAQETQQQLNEVLQRFDTIADSAQRANQVATTTGNATAKTQETVTRTLDNLQTIRDGVKETSKRLKRLGERSQEISNIITLINNIAERTTVLALNASMQATAAGEAGRGFSLIAEEIQRLAESSRDSTEQIATLVYNIQQEANITISTMEKAIEQVITGSDLAEETATQMRVTLKATNELIDSVEQIATSSADQVALSRAIQVRAERILEATQTTGRELSSLTHLTKTMTDYSRRLVSSVNVFKLEG
ncbi:methyl-accepting chemotaxis protein [Thiofilum flexile]|uniref:methyl-accepting chemotaxis protein n=1 Tax=Thiofilum flexile TaxID=125627 RepID=UPI0003706897|nr:methyl-accepting chemotaxis protein [Thiofilum flexile]